MNETQIKTLKHLGFSCYAKSEYNWMLQRNGHDVATFLHTEEACWNRAAALAGLHELFPGWMMMDEMRKKRVKNIDINYNFTSHLYTVYIKDVNGEMCVGELFKLPDAICEAFNKLMEMK